MNEKIEKLDFLEGLNEQQKRAVFEEHNRVCLIAGPGCGKTRTLIAKALYLIYVKKVNPDKILVLTFAKKAVWEIRKRVACHFQERQKITNVFNFHSFCYSLLLTHGYLLGLFPKLFVIYDQSDQQMVIEQFRKEVVSSYKKTTREVLRFINNVKNGRITLNLINEKEIQYELEIYKEYERYLRKNNALDFNDILLYTIKLLTEYPMVRQKCWNRFSYLLIDESQDLNAVQHQITSLLSGPNQNVLTVGDFNQRIYSFQGANPQRLLELVKGKDWKTLYLSVNYRSTKNIISLSNTFLRNNEDMVLNELVGFHQPLGRKITLVEFTYLSRLISFIYSFKEKEKLNWSEIIVLYRNNYFSKAIEVELIKRCIPYEILGSYNLFDREEIKDAFSILRTVIYQDDLSLLRVLKFWEGVGVKTIENIQLFSKKESLTVYDSLKAEKMELGKKQRQRLTFLLEKIEAWREKLSLLSSSKAGDHLWDLLEDFGYLHYLRGRHKLDYEKREENLKQLLNITKDWIRRSNSFSSFETSFSDSLSNFLHWILISFEKEKKNKNALVLSSIHQVKGLEFEAVFFVYLDQGIIPSRQSSNDELSEEKRLFYVGLTRAKSFLYLVSSRHRASSFVTGLRIDEKEIERLVI